jgi:hypothetical protein
MSENEAQSIAVNDFAPLLAHTLGALETSSHGSTSQNPTNIIQGGETMPSESVKEFDSDTRAGGPAREGSKKRGVFATQIVLYIEHSFTILLPWCTKNSSLVQEHSLAGSLSEASKQHSFFLMAI